MMLATFPLSAFNAVEVSHDVSIDGAIEPSHAPPTSFITHGPIIVQDDLDFESQQWEGNGSYVNPYMIENLNITVDSQICIMIYNVTAHFVIRNSYLSTTGELADNLLILNSRNGIVDNCSITGGSRGIEIRASTEITVANCTIYGTGSMGIAVYLSDRCHIISNSIYGTYTGIIFHNSANGAVIGNKIYRAETQGISMYFGTSDNQIFYNFIGWNGPDDSIDLSHNAADNGQDNVWDDNISLGNFWWGYDGGDNYQINGVGGASDRFPHYFNDTESPVFIRRADDLSYEDSDERNYQVQWEASDSNPYRYEIEVNGILVESEIWHWQTVSLDVGGLKEGVYNYTIDFIDGSGNLITDFVIVYVVHYILGDIGTTLVGSSSIIAVFVVLVALILMRKLG
jgi:parallel beta-helix repeat protein